MFTKHGSTQERKQMTDLHIYHDNRRGLDGLSMTITGDTSMLLSLRPVMLRVRVKAEDVNVFIYCIGDWVIEM